MSKEELSLIDMLMCSTKTRMDTIIQSPTLSHKELDEDLSPRTLIFLNSQSSDTNLDSLRPTPIPSAYGKLNSETLLMVHKSLSINSFALEKLNGTLETVLSCFYLTATMVTVLNILQQESKDICNSVTRMNLFLLTVSIMIIRTS